MNFRKLPAGVRLVKKEFNILPATSSNDRNRRRIAILIVDEFLRAGDDVHQAFYLKANLYQTLKKINLTCEPIPEEKRLQELSRSKRQKMRDFGPLKLVSNNVKLGYRKPYPATKVLVKILMEDADGFSRDNIRGGTPQTFKHLQKDASLFTKQKRISLYRADSV